MNPYDQFHKIIYGKLHYLSWLMGQDILSEDFRIKPRAIFCVLFEAFATPILMLWSAIYSEKELGLKAMALVPIGVQASSFYLINWLFRTKNSPKKFWENLKKFLGLLLARNTGGLCLHGPMKCDTAYPSNLHSKRQQDRFLRSVTWFGPSRQFEYVAALHRSPIECAQS